MTIMSHLYLRQVRVLRRGNLLMHAEIASHSLRSARNDMWVNVLRECDPTVPPARQAVHLPLQGEAGGGYVRVDAVHFG